MSDSLLKSLGLDADECRHLVRRRRMARRRGRAGHRLDQPDDGRGDRAACAATTPAQYEQRNGVGRGRAKAWRSVPAPKRGEAVRLIGEELREHKSALGSLVSLEMGKIKAEGEGEVQEMIDIGDFAVGLSRMLYGVQMHSERPKHRMFEQWHPLGVVGVITAFNFPVAVWSWNALLAAVCGDVTVWKPSPKTRALRRRRAAHLQPRAREQRLPADLPARHRRRHGTRDRFVEDRRVALVSFTGSTAVGRDVGAARREAARQVPARARRQQRDHRRRVREPGPRRAGHGLRRGGHRGPALHDDAPRVRARIAHAPSSSGAWSRPTSRCASAIRSRRAR